MRRWVLVAAAVLALAVAGGALSRTGDAAPDAPRLRVGVVANTLGWGRLMGREQDLAAAAGARWLREDLAWDAVVPRRGARRWAAFDRLLASAAHRGLHVLPVLGGTPPWARTPNSQLPTADRAYGAFVRDAVHRYGPAGTFWRAHPELDAALAPRWFELWNEPFLVGEQDGRVPARRYAALARAGIEAGRAADPGARFLVALDIDSAGRPGVAQRWLERLLAARPELLTQADGIAVHPYGIGTGNDSSTLRALIDDLRQRGVSLPLWITEIGWSTCGPERRCVSDRRQATNLSRLLTDVRTRFAQQVAAVFVYRLRDLLPRAPRERFEADFGLVRFDGRHKPSWAVYRRFARRQAGG